MSWIAEALLHYHNFSNSVSRVQAALTKTSRPLRLGVLSTAGINFAAVFDPVSTHPDVVIAGVASRSLDKAQAHIDKYKLNQRSNSKLNSGGNASANDDPTHVKAYGSYEALLSDPTIDAVYISLPNGMHAEWTVKALEAGKHVLVEKPIANNAAEAQMIKDAAEKTGKVVLEAFHWRFHPAAHFVRSLVTGENSRENSGKQGYGRLQEINVKFLITAGALGKDDIRYNYELGGGSCMDAVYVFSALAYFAGAGTGSKADDRSFTVEQAVPRLSKKDARIDEAMSATILIHNGKRTDSVTADPQSDRTTEPDPSTPVKCTIETDLCAKAYGLIPKFWDAMPSVTLECERARIEFSAFIAPWLNHTITITEKDDKGKLIGSKGKTKKEKVYAGGPEWNSVDAEGLDAAKGENPEIRGQPWWTTYRFQLEAFVDRIRAVEENRAVSGPWVGLDESLWVMSLVDAVYDKAGLPRRGVV